MGAEFIRGLVRQTVDMFNKPKTYDGMDQDLHSVSMGIIPPDPCQNVETISSDLIGEGTPQEALDNLQKVMGIPEIAKEIHRLYGHSDSVGQSRKDIRKLESRINELQDSDN